MSSSSSVKHFDLRSKLRPYLAMVNLGSASTDEITLAWVEGAAGSHVPTHSHSQSQFTVVVSGNVRVTTPTGAYQLGCGQAIYIPGGASHGAEIIASAVYVDVFCPARHDLDTGTSRCEKGRAGT